MTPIKVNVGSVISAGTSDSLIEGGEKENCSIVALKIKNFDMDHPFLNVLGR